MITVKCDASLPVLGAKASTYPDGTLLRSTRAKHPFLLLRVGNFHVFSFVEGKTSEASLYSDSYVPIDADLVVK